MLLSWSMLCSRAQRPFVELRHRPDPAGTAPYFPQEAPAACAPCTSAPGEVKWFCASAQGARPHHEDGYTARAPLFAVHDGHGGRGAVDRLRAFMAQVEAPSDARGLVDMYAAAAADICGEASGVVSACVLLGEGGAAHLAWIGDCTAAVFNPETGRVCVADVTRVDGDEVVAETGAALATEPHALSPGVRSWVRWHKEPAGLGRVGVPRRFEDGRSQHEYEQLCRSAGRELPVHINVWLPFAPQGMSARIAGSVEPTRALGDALQSGTVGRGAEVMSALSCPPGSFAALASDGMLDGGAFQDMESLCMFLADPLSFIRHRFYGPWQNLTTLLVAGNQLPCVQPKPDELGRYPLYAAWHRCATWEDVRSLLKAHLEAVGRLRPQGKGTWYQACAASVRWVCELTEGGDVLRSPNRVVYAAVHMAVIMGSQDNVTVMAVRMP